MKPGSMDPKQLVFGNFFHVFGAEPGAAIENIHNFEENYPGIGFSCEFVFQRWGSWKSKIPLFSLGEIYIYIHIIYLFIYLGGGFKLFFIFTPILGEDEPILTHFFQMGWFNHQTVFVEGVFFTDWIL